VLSYIFVDSVTDDYSCCYVARFFDPGDSPLSDADNPPATVVSSMPQYRDHSPEMAYYSGTGYFWATKAVAGDSLHVIFDIAQNLSRIIVQTGHSDHPKDILHSGHLSVSPSVMSLKKDIVSCDSPKSVAVFHDGAAVGDHLETVLSFLVKCIQVTVDVNHDHWVVFANVAVYLSR